MGILLGGVPGVAPAKAVVIGGGVVGANAIMMALGMGADVTSSTGTSTCCAGSPGNLVRR
jgi:alanine dehydrogenase